jgi:hypothetical protein
MYFAGGANKDPSDVGGRVPLLRWQHLIGPHASGQIPYGSKINKAELSVKTASAGADQPTYIHRVLQPWNENEASWRMYASGLLWSVSGCSDPGVDYFNDSDDPFPQNMELPEQRYTFNVASGVQAWANGEPNNGWTFITPTSGAIGSLYAEGNGTALEDRPILSVVYEPPEVEPHSTPVYAYPVDNHQKSPHPGVYRQVPDWSLLSGIHPYWRAGEASEDERVWEPSGGEFWLTRPKWYSIPSSGLTYENVVSLAETPADDLATSVRISRNVDDDLYVSYDNVDASGDYVHLDDNLNIDPTQSFMYHNKMLVLTDTTVASGVLNIHPPGHGTVQDGEIVHIIGSLTSPDGVPLEGIEVVLNTRNALGFYIDNGTGQTSWEVGMTERVQSNQTWQLTKNDGTVHYKFKVQPKASTLNLTPMSFRLSAPDLDTASDWIDVDCALTLKS